MRLARWKALSSLEVILRFAIRLCLRSLMLEVTLSGWVTLSGLERFSLLVGKFTGHVSLSVTLKTSAFFTIFPFIGFSEEGRCFECNRQGHMARECPNKKRQPFKS